MPHPSSHIDGRAIEPQPDPIFTAINACERLEAIAAPEEDGNAEGDATPAQTAAVMVVGRCVGGALSETVPQTAAGGSALARPMMTVLDERTRAYALGATDDLQKPVDWDALHAVMSRFRQPAATADREPPNR